MIRLRHAAIAVMLSTSLAAAPAGRAAEDKPAAGFANFSFTSRKDPIKITSDRLDFDYKSRKTLFRGAVEVVQGDVHLRSDQLTVFYADQAGGQQLREVTAEGHVRILQGARQASGDRGVFDQAARTLTLSGNAVLEEGSNRVRGDTILVYPDESRMEVKGQNSRVTLEIFPGEKSSLPEARSSRTPGEPSDGTAPSP